MKKAGINRKARRAGTAARPPIPAATPEYLSRYVDTERRAGRLFNLEDTVRLLNDNTRTAIRIVFTAMMEGHVAGSARILRDVDPLVSELYRDLERMTRQDGADYAEAKLEERFQKAKRQTFRPVRGLEHITGGGDH